MEFIDKMELLPSGIYNRYLLDKLFAGYDFKSKFLEIGSGTGEFLLKLERKGFSGISVDINQDTVQYCKKRITSPNIQIFCKSFFEITDTFNTIFMFEVLEHIEDDVSTLEKMYNLLNDHGYLLLAMPANPRLFSDEDRFMGHLRRYEKKDITCKLEKTGFTILKFWSYNFFPYITRYFIKGHTKEHLKNRDTRTKESSHDFHPTTEKLVKLLYPLYSKLTFLLKVQNPFLNTDLGAHYLVLAQK